MMIKPIGANGQVTLCTKYAGQYVAIEEMELGVWILKLGDFIPRSERWLHEPAFAAELDEALEWASTHPREPPAVREQSMALNNAAMYLGLMVGSGLASLWYSHVGCSMLMGITTYRRTNEGAARWR